MGRQRQLDQIPHYEVARYLSAATCPRLTGVSCPTWTYHEWYHLDDRVGEREGFVSFDFRLNGPLSY